MRSLMEYHEWSIPVSVLHIILSLHIVVSQGEVSSRMLLGLFSLLCICLKKSDQKWIVINHMITHIVMYFS